MNMPGNAYSLGSGHLSIISYFEDGKLRNLDSPDTKKSGLFIYETKLVNFHKQ